MIGAVLSRVTGLFDGFASSAVLLREAARTSRRWQTYAARAGFSGALFGVLLLGIYTAVNAPFVDISNISYAGKGIFYAFSAVLLLLAILLAPLMTSAAMIEETEDRTLEMLILSKLRPTQILTGKVLSRILILVTIVFGAMPVMAMVVTLGGVAPQAVVAVTVHTLVAVVLMGSLGAFFGLFTRSPMLAMMASAAYSIPTFWLLPIGYVLCTGHPNDSAHFSLFAGPVAEDWSSPLAILSYFPSLIVIGVVGTRLFDLKVSNADIRRAFSTETWGTKTWAIGLVLAVVTGVTILPMFAIGTWSLRFGRSGGTVSQLMLIGCMGVVWLWWTFALTLLTWALLRVGVDVVDAMDAILGGRGKRKRDRRNFRVWRNPIAWREARPAAWGSNGVPVLATWLLVMLGMLQTGWWIIPGGALVMGVMNTVAAIGFTLWLGSRTIAEERRNKSLEVLLTTTMASWRILLGKAAGIVAPTFPLLALSLPFIAFGVPHLHMFDLAGPNGAAEFSPGHWFVRGCLTWLWTIPLWGVVLWGSMFVALRVRRARSGLSVGIGLLIAVLGVPTVIGRLFEQSWILATPCRIVAPPLAGSAEVWQYAVSMIGWSGLVLFLFLWSSIGLRRWIAAGLGLALALGLALSSPAYAQAGGGGQPVQLQDNFLMVAEPLGDGILRPEQWAPVRIKIANRGGAARATVKITERSGTESVTFSRPVDLPKGVRKDIVLLYRPNTSEGNREVVLTTRSGRVARASFRVRSADEHAHTVGIFGTDMMGIQGIRTAEGAVPGPEPRALGSDPRGVVSGLIEPGVLPLHSAGYDPFDQLVWPQADPSGLDPAQAAALRHWVADGGHLLLTVTENWKALQDSGLGEMLPVRFTGTADRTDLYGVLRTLGGRFDGQPTPMAVGALNTLPGRSSFVRAEAEDGTPIWVTGTYGLGTVTVFTLDPRSKTFKGNVDTLGLWERLLSLPVAPGRSSVQAIRGEHRMPSGALEPWNDPSLQLLHALHLLERADDTILAGNTRWEGAFEYDYNMPFDADGPFRWEAEIRSWLSDIPGVAPLPMSWLLAFSGVYLFVIGPLDWFALRLLRKQPWTWVTFPVTIVVFSAAALAGTAWMKGSQAMVSTVEVIDLLPGTDLWRGDTYVGVFTTSRTQVVLSTPAQDSVAQPLEEQGYALDTRMAAGFGPGVIAYGADTWTLGYSNLRWTDTAPGSIGFEVLPEGGWAVTNQLPFALTDAEIAVLNPGNNGTSSVFPIGPLDAGERKVVDLGARVSFEGARDDHELGWLRERAFDAPTLHRGYLDVNTVRLVFLATAERVAPLSVEGVRPIHRNRTLIRAPLLPSLDPTRRGNAAIPGLGDSL